MELTYLHNTFHELDEVDKGVSSPAPNPPSGGGSSSGGGSMNQGTGGHHRDVHP